MTRAEAAARAVERLRLCADTHGVRGLSERTYDALWAHHLAELNGGRPVLKVIKGGRS